MTFILKEYLGGVFMHWILPIAGIIAAIAFLILCIGIVVVLISVKKNLDHVAKTLDGVEGQVQVLVKLLIYFIKLIA